MNVKYALVVLICLEACSHQETWLQNAPITMLEVSKDIEYVPIPQDSIVLPEIIATCDDYVIWSEKKGNCLLKISDCEGNILSSGIKKGRALDELLNITQILIHNRGFIVCDVFKKKAYSFSLEKNLVIKDKSFDIDAFSTIAVSGDTIVGVAKHGKCKYESKLIGGKTISKFGDYSYYGLNTEIGCGLLQGHICINEVKGRIACFSYYAGAYEIADYRCHKIVRSEKLEDFSFDGNSGGQVLMGPESKLNFISTVSSENFIYALYDGKDLKYYMMNRGDSPSGHNICVFDWNGNYVKCIKLDVPVTSISWNHDDKRLYVSVLVDGHYKIGAIKTE